MKVLHGLHVEGSEESAEAASVEEDYDYDYELIQRTHVFPETSQMFRLFPSPMPPPMRMPINVPPCPMLGCNRMYQQSSGPSQFMYRSMPFPSRPPMISLTRYPPPPPPQTWQQQGTSLGSSVLLSTLLKLLLTPPVDDDYEDYSYDSYSYDEEPSSSPSLLELLLFSKSLGEPGNIHIISRGNEGSYTPTAEISRVSPPRATATPVVTPTTEEPPKQQFSSQVVSGKEQVRQETGQNVPGVEVGAPSDLRQRMQQESTQAGGKDTEPAEVVSYRTRP
jgi:hypothetical protein